jgi:hypothetical protein
MANDQSRDREATSKTTPAEEDLIRKIEDEVIRRIRRKWWIVGALAVLVGFFGIKEIIRAGTESDIRAAQRAAILAEEKANRAATVTQEAATQTSNYSKTVGALQDDATKVQGQFIALRERLETESRSLQVRGERAQQDVAARLAKLEELVAKVAQDAQVSRQAVEAYRKDADKAKAAAEAESGRFAENARYDVTLFFTPETKDSAESARGLLTKERI